MLDLDAIERRAREAVDTPFRVPDGADRDCFTAFATLGPGQTIAVIAALRAVLETTPEELADEVFREWALLGPNELAKATMDYFRAKAGVAP